MLTTWAFLGCCMFAFFAKIPIYPGSSLSLRTVFRPTWETVPRLKSSVKPPIKHNSECLGSAFFFPSIFLLLRPLVLGLNEVQRWWARPSPFTKHFNLGILLFLWQANCPTPVYPGGPWYHVQVPARSPHSRTLVMSQTASPFPSFRIFPMNSKFIVWFLAQPPSSKC